MWNLLTRVLIFIFLILAGLWVGWEFVFGGIIFLSVIGKPYWEYILLGPILDINLLFPHGFFSIVIAVLMISNALSSGFIKSETNFSQAVKAFVMSLGVVVISFFVFSVIGKVGYWNALTILSLVFLKIFLSALLLIFIVRIKETINVSPSFAK
ncbi:hypothetical protein HYT00_01650 [Candidatus Giovannonibacteria bacterium]|nr:hypothetical protein [Candidatus Giovannonibacteria bacterium]